MTEGCAAKRGSLERVLDDESLVLLDHLAAERRVAQRFGQGQALAGFEPLPVAVDESHRDDRHAKQALGEPGDAVEGFLGGRVEHVVSMQRGKPLPLALAGVDIRHQPYSNSAHIYCR